MFGRDKLTCTGLTIGREIKDKSGHTFIRLDSDKSDACVVVRDQKDGDFFILHVYSKDEANWRMDRWEKSY